MLEAEENKALPGWQLSCFMNIRGADPHAETAVLTAWQSEVC
jgi:hypothetical protein